MSSRLLTPLFLATLIISSCSHNKPDNTLVVGMLGADAPFMSLNEHGQFEGFDVDVATNIATHLNKKLVIKEMGFAELFIALEQNSIDMIMCGLSITNARMEKFSMVHYQGTGCSSHPLVFWKEIPTGVVDLHDLKDRNTVIGVIPGTTQEQFLSRFPFITSKAIDGYANIIMELQFGKIDAAFFDSAIASYAQRFPELKIVNIPLGNFQELGHGIAIKKDNLACTNQITTAVQHLKDNGIIAQLEEQWLQEGN